MAGSHFAIINGHLIDPANNISEPKNIFIKDGHISEVSSRVPGKRDSVIDAKNLIVTPGFIDLHTHLRDPGYEYKEDIESGAKAAAAGGFTSIFCMANTKPVNDSRKTTRYIIDKAEKVSEVEIYPVGAISLGLNGRELADIEGMVSEGVLAISDDGRSIDDAGLMKKGMEIAKKLGILISSHPEDFQITGEGVVNEGLVAERLGLSGISSEAEDSVIARDIRLAVETGARFHVAHVSTASGIDLVRKAKEKGADVTCEVTPHHLLLTDESVLSLGGNGIMKPPLRSELDRQALIKGLQDGTVDAIATDHAPHAPDEKIFSPSSPPRLCSGQAQSSPQWGEEVVLPLPSGKKVGVRGRGCAFGVIGMETAFPVCYRLVEGGVISLERLIELLTSGPARVSGLERGSLAVGQKANLTILDLDSPFDIDSDKFYSKGRNCPYNGWRVHGQIFYTIVGGKVIYRRYA